MALEQLVSILSQTDPSVMDWWNSANHWFRHNIMYLLREYPYLIYAVLVVWTFIEGETIVIVVGALAAQAAKSSDFHPNIVLVILAAFAGSLAGDQTWFIIGRFKGKALLAKRPVWQKRADKVFRMLERHQNWLMLSFRFLYGLRNVTPFAIGMSNIKTIRFFVYNTIGAIIWATAFGLGGFIFGRALENVLHKYKFLVLAGVAALVLVIWLIRVLIRRRSAKKELAAASQELPGQGDK